MVRVIYRIFYFFFLGSFAYLLLLAATQPYQKITWVAPVSVFLFLCAVYFGKKNRTRLSKWWTKLVRNTDRVFLLLLSVSFVILLIFSWCLRVNPEWDYGQIVHSAYEYATSGKMSAIDYFGQYPNNHLMLFIMTSFFRLLLAVVPGASLEICQWSTLPLNCIFISAAIYMTYQTAKLCMSREKALAAGVICLACSPLYLYSPILYTDTLGLLPLVLIFYFYLKFRKVATGKRWIYCLLCCIIGIIGYFLKAFIIIGLIAVTLDYILESIDIKKRGKQIAAFVSILALCSVLIGATLPNALRIYSKISPHDVEKYQLPLTHWVMMGLTAYGGFNQEDLSFSQSFASIAEKRAGNLGVIKKRLQKLGVGGTLYHIFYTKWWFTWSYPTCAADDFLLRSPVDPGLLYQTFTKDGRYYNGYLVYAHSYWLIVLFGVLLSAWKSRETRTPLFPIHLAIFGLLLFLSVWECSARYLTTFLPLILLCASDGIGTVLEKTPEDPLPHSKRIRKG